MVENGQNDLFGGFMSFIQGQRWASEAEPELGLGTVVRMEENSVRMAFPATNVIRNYALQGSPLYRIKFSEGEWIKDEEGRAFQITGVEENDDVLTYICGDVMIEELNLDPRMSVGSAKKRLFRGQFDSNRAFRLRQRVLEMELSHRQNPAFGLSGARIDLIAHQLYIADTVSNRIKPRVLLADEVGLGKTIEAGLIVHRLLRSERAGRVLIVVPDALVNQWFVELYRRFNLSAHIFDPEKYAVCDATAKNNPFNDHQVVLVSLKFLLESGWGKFAQMASWDMLVVDEAHHLGWSPDAPSSEYQLVEKLANNSDGCLLLTATPEQLGAESHFARLRLLDPDRYFDFAAFEEESAHYRELAREVEALEGSADFEAKKAEKLDEYGTGRVMFRNTRARLKGFPPRCYHPVDLPAVAEDQLWTAADPRVGWLTDFLQKLAGEKVLLILKTREQAETLQQLVLEKLNIKVALFHEGLSLLQRDRNAAYFAEEDGAQLLICSEIGSEGRNFQFAHHLVLMELPADPELLEQRIGRLDRIGQTSDINLYVPAVKGTTDAALAHWYHEGLDAFSTHFEFGDRFADLAEKVLAEGPKPKLLKETAKRRAVLQEELTNGRDRLLEWNSFDGKVADRLVKAVADLDADHNLEALVIDLLDLFAVPYEEIGHRAYVIGGSGEPAVDIPALPTSGLTGTFDRRQALSRDDVNFLSWDHPFVTGLFEVVKGLPWGNCGFSALVDGSDRELMLEVHYALDAQGPAHLELSRFLGDGRVAVLVNHALQDCTALLAGDFVEEQRDASSERVVQARHVMKKVLPSMLKKCASLAEERATPLMKGAVTRAKEMLGAELNRLQHLQAKNPNVTADELSLMQEKMDQTIAALEQASLQLQGICLVWKGDSPD